MEDGIRRAADRGVDADRIFERLSREDLRDRDVLADEVDDASAGELRERGAARVNRGDGRVAVGAMPSASAILAIVDAVPIVMQWPLLRD